MGCERHLLPGQSWQSALAEVFLISTSVYPQVPQVDFRLGLPVLLFPWYGLGSSEACWAAREPPHAPPGWLAQGFLFSQGYLAADLVAELGLSVT